MSRKIHDFNKIYLLILPPFNNKNTTLLLDKKHEQKPIRGIYYGEKPRKGKVLKRF